MVERQTPERTIGVGNLPPPCCVLEQDTLLSENTGNTWRKQWHRPDMTEILLTGHKPQNKQTNKQTNKQNHY